MKYNTLQAGWMWLCSLRDRVPDRWVRLANRLWHWRNKLATVMLIPLLLMAACTPIVATPATPEPTPTEAAEIVLCIGIVRDAQGGQHVFFQRGSETLEQTLAQDGKQHLVDEGFTVEHRDCFDSWQKAADFLTDGAVTLPENATEQDFIMELMQWKQMQY